MTQARSQWTEHETQRYYDGEAAVYRLLWGRFSTWGTPANTDSDDLEAAQLRHYARLVQAVDLQPGQRVLDIGSGDGDMILELAGQFPECSFVGVELSPVRCRNANQALTRQSEAVRARVAFVEGSALQLPFEDGSFDCILSSGVFYHVPDTRGALAEAFRVLRPGGAMAFDDLQKPSADVSEDAWIHVYKRLGFDTDLNLESYRDALQKLGFDSVRVTDQTPDMCWTYLCLSRKAARLAGSNKEHGERLRSLTHAYQQTVSAARRREVGWLMASCRKPDRRARESAERNLVREVYAADGDPQKLRGIYDVWASFYDRDLADNHGWRGPEVSVACLARRASPASRVLDVGAGTGSVGALLSSRGFRRIVGLDMSPGMLAEATRKGVYESLIEARLGEALPIEDDQFDHAVASGVFTFGHAPPEALGELCRVVRAGGSIVLTLPFKPSTSGSYVHQLKQVVHALEAEGRCVVAEISAPIAILPQSEPDARHQVWTLEVQ